jgi:hypothetical protein
MSHEALVALFFWVQTGMLSLDDVILFLIHPDCCHYLMPIDWRNVAKIDKDYSCLVHNAFQLDGLDFW